MTDTVAPIDKVLGGRYRLTGPLGHGGMATVFRARDQLLRRDVAVKVYHAAESQSARIDGELAVLASLDHHAVVQLMDAGSEQDDYGRVNRFIVMALVHGADLHMHITSGARLTARHIAEIGYDMAEALDYVHARKVIHRDIKPSNVLLVDYRDGSIRARAKLTDFGIALADDIERLTAQGITTGTAGYLSPEQASGAPITPATDVYSLGLVLLQCFTRRLEFPGSAVESAVARLERDPVMPPELSELWRRLLTAMTSRNPEDRPQRHDLVAAFRQIVIAESGRHREEPAPPVFPSADARTAALIRETMLDTLPNQALDTVTAMAARIFAAPIAIVSVSDRDRTWFRSHYGAGVDEIARQIDLTDTAPPSEQPVIVEDGRSDPRTSNSPLVTGPLGLRFYVGVPLRRANGEVIGTLSVLDIIPRTVSPAELANLEDLATLVVSHLELRQLSLLTTVEMTAPH